MNSVSVYCLIFTHVLPFAVTETFLVETHHDDDTKQSVAPKSKAADGKRPNEADHKSVSSNKEEEHLTQAVGQDYSSQAGSVWLDLVNCPTR